MSDRRPNPSDPTAERTSEQSTPSASGLTGGRPDSEDVRRNDDHDDLTPRGAEDDRAMPSRPDSDEDTVMPTDDSSLGTKI
jgi:hypothetical protein